LKIGGIVFNYRDDAAFKSYGDLTNSVRLSAKSRDKTTATTAFHRFAPSLAVTLRAVQTVSVVALHMT
jgi:hypothetical protein